MFCVALLAGVACDKKTASAPALSSTSAPAVVTDGIVSLSPAATELLVGMNAAGRVVGVSNYEPAESALSDLPKVGDYQRTDWEKIDAAQPKYMIVQGRRDRLPAGLADRAAERGITLVTLEIDRLDDVLKAVDTLAEQTHAPGGRAFKARLQDLIRTLDMVARKERAGSPPVRTLIVLSDDGTGVVGTRNFLDDLLTLAGGKNVVETTGFPTLDREKITALAPDVILQLMPDATDANIAKAAAAWQQTPTLPAVRNGRIYTLKGSSVLMPGSRVVGTGLEMFKCLYPLPPER